MRDEIKWRLENNITRVESLIGFYNRSGAGRRKAEDSDVLRAAVVFLHASLEDFLRSLIQWKLPQSTDVGVLNKFTLIRGLDGQALKKIDMEFFVNNRDKSCKTIINDAISAWLERSNFNNTREVASLLESLGIISDELRAYFELLQQMMDRRHNIVHRADSSKKGGQGNHSVKSIGIGHVENWIAAVKRFTDAVLNSIND